MFEIAEEVEFMKTRVAEVCVRMETGRGPVQKHPAFRVDSLRECVGKENLDNPI
jgi:hypothetical protein